MVAKDLYGAVDRSKVDLRLKPPRSGSFRWMFGELMSEQTDVTTNL